MEFAARLMCRSQQSLQESVPKPKRSMEVDDDTPTLHKWKRLLMMLMLVTQHAETGLMIQYLETMRHRKAQEAWDLYVKIAGSEARTRIAQKAGRKKDGPMPMAKGKALSRSTAVKNPEDPEMCPHKAEDMSHPRGGRNNMLWVTCLRCGSRWERVQTPSSQPSRDSASVEEEFVQVEVPLTDEQQTSLTKVFEMYRDQPEMTW